MADEVSADEDYSLAVASSIQRKSGQVSLVSPYGYSVFRVPEMVRRRDSYAYRPSAISIGRLHRDDRNEYLFMENVKRLYFQSILLNGETYDIDLLRLVRAVTKIETQARQCYADDLDHINSEDFVKMLVIDGCFLVEFLRRQSFHIEPYPNDPISRIFGLRHTIYQDLVLLENQLPWRVLDNLYTELRMSTELHNDFQEFSLTDLVMDFFKLESGIDFFLSWSPNSNMYLHQLCTSLMSLEVPSLLQKIQNTMLHKIQNTITSTKSKIDNVT